MSAVTTREPRGLGPPTDDRSAGQMSMNRQEVVGKAPDRKVILSTLWVFAVLNYLYADVFGLYFNPAVLEEAKTFTGGAPLVVLAAAVLMETAIAMVVLSRLLRYRANRWANVAAGVLHTVAVAGSMSLAPYSAFFASIEIACTLFIVWYAWTWHRPVGQPGGAALAR